MDSLKSCFCLLITAVFLFSTAAAAPTISGGEEFSPVGTNVAYSCDAGANFIVNVPGFRSYDTRLQSEVMELEAIGITFEAGGSQSVLTVLASEQNNGTQVHCQMFNPVTGNTSPSETLRLTVIGPPLPPGVNSTLHNVTTILVEWDEPFTWSGHSVLSYIVTELITGEVVGNTTYDATDTSHTYSSPTGGVAETCQLVSFEVAAVSDVGTGEAGVATGGLLIALGMLETPQVEVMLQSNDNPEVTITVQPPVVCEFQEATLTIQVTETNSSTGNALPETTRSYSGQPSEVSAMYTVADGLTADTNYTVRAEVESSTGTVFAEAAFNTLSDSSYHLLPMLCVLVWSTLSAVLVTTLLG